MTARTVSEPLTEDKSMLVVVQSKQRRGGTKGVVTASGVAVVAVEGSDDGDMVERLVMSDFEQPHTLAKTMLQTQLGLQIGRSKHDKSPKMFSVEWDLTTDVRKAWTSILI